MGSIYVPTQRAWEGGMAWTLGRLFPSREALWEDSLGPDQDENPRADALVGVDARHLAVSICSDRSSRLHHAIPDLSGELMACGHSVRWVHEPEDLQGGDICLFLGYGGGLDGALASLHTHNLLVRESALCVEADESIPVSVLAADPATAHGFRELRKLVLRRRGEVPEDFFTWRTSAVFRLCKSFVNGYPGSLSAQG